MQSGNLDVSVPLSEVTDVTVLPGIFTKISGYRDARLVLKVRCYRASKFAEAILAARDRLA